MKFLRLQSSFSKRPKNSQTFKRNWRDTMNYDIRAVQKRLKELGFNPGPVDGVLGRRTIEAVKAFQAKEKLDIKMPGTIGPKTLAALFPEGGGKVEVTPLTTAPWFDLALRKKGLHEARDFSELSKFLKKDGKTLGDPRKLPWCGDFVETCIAVTVPGEPLPTNPYLARNWMKFGSSIKPTFGAVLVFWRGTKDGSSGHVGFAAGESSSSYYVLGGNQSDAITVVAISKARLLGARWPNTVPRPEIHLATMAGGVLSINEA
jgi:uncharacterized protein (TIGR02594 family)